MNFNDLTNRLSEKQKQRLVEAKTQEDLDELFTPSKLLLTDDQLGKVAGGTCSSYGGCFRALTPEESEPPVPEPHSPSSPPVI